MKVPVKVVDIIDHDWKVVKKKRLGHVNYYLLKDVLNEDVYKIVKESTDQMEHFSGKIVEYEDIEKKYNTKDVVIKGGKIKEVDVQVPYIHKLWDYAECSYDEASSIFGGNYRPFVLENKYGMRENLFYKKKETPVSKDKKKS